MAPDIIERLKESALSSALTIYPCQIRVHQTLIVLNSNFLGNSSEEGVIAGHSWQFTSGGYLSTVTHTTLAGNAYNRVW